MTTQVSGDLENLRCERDGAIAVITVNRPKVLNASIRARWTSSGG
jgi:enoyl-CoA hydratase/carnithine racemase